MEREVVEPVDPFGPDGLVDPRAAGWARAPLFRGQLRRRFAKRWVYWCVVSDECVLALTVADVGYLGIAAVALFDGQRWIEDAAVAPLALGVRLPEGPRGNLSFPRPLVEVREEPEGTRLRAGFRRRGDELQAEILAVRPAGEESLDVLAVWDRTHHQLTSKHVALPARGEARLNGRSLRLDAQTRAFAFLDHGRGLWPYRTRWQWACAAGEQDGRRYGLNLGGTWTQGAGVTENALFVDGRIHKIARELRVELDEGGVPRRLWGENVDLSFAAETRRVLGVNLLALRSRLRWGLGTFSGVIGTPSGARVELRALRGFAEDHAARW
jgi:hypothetical protein